MNYPTKKTFYILFACIISLSAITYVKNITAKNSEPISLETSSGTNNVDFTNLNDPSNQLATQNTEDNFSGQNLTDRRLNVMRD